jgi:hypothetical protein
MTNIRNQSALVNGDATPSRQKFRLQDKLHGDRRLTDAERCVGYFIIDWYGIGGRDYTFTRHERLAEYTHLDVRTVRRCIARLVALGYITIKTRGRWGRASEYVPVFLPVHEDIALSSCSSAHEDIVLSSCSSAHEDIALSGHEDIALSAHEDIAMSTHTPTIPVVQTKGMVWTADAGALAPDGARTPRGGEAVPEKAVPEEAVPEEAVPEEAVPIFKRLWALPWIDKSFKAKQAGKRAVDETMARADAPPEVLLVAKAESYLANVPRAKQRWLSVWLRDEGWLCDESPAKPERASKANGKAAPERAKPESAPRGEFESEDEYIAREAGFPVGTRVRDKERARMGKVLAGRAHGKVKLLVLWDSRDRGWYSPSCLEVVAKPAPREPEPPSPVQLRAKEAGLVVGARVRDVADHECEDDRFEEIGRVVAVSRDGHVAVQWRDSDPGPHHEPEDCWGGLQVVAP